MDTTQAYLVQQNDMLRDIRDDIRSSRMTSGAPFGGGTAAMMGRPGNTFVQSQIMADRMISGDWNNLGWANAYKSNFRSNLASDVTGAMGFSRAPNTLTQFEYQQLSTESLKMRAGHFLGSLVAPSYIGQVEDLGKDIFANSQRFASLGSPMAGVLGSGMSFTGAHKLAQQVQGLSFNDMRMNGQDYSTLTQVGMRTGQYDQVRSTDDFLAKTKELAQATGDLTRTLRLSVEEISQSMGNLRRFGVTDVADQRRTLMNFQAAAQVSGLTTGEVLNAAAGAMQAGMGMGISAQVSGAAAADTLARVRNQSRGGATPGYIMAMGGGVEGVQQSISNAQMKFLSSNQGYYGYLGGGSDMGANSMNAFMGGLGETGGTLQGILSSQARQMEFTNELKNDPRRMNQLYKNNLDTQLRMVIGGTGPLVGEQARDLAFASARGEMGDAAALVFANENYTTKGQFIRDSTEFQMAGARRSQASKLQYDDWYANNSFGGQFNRGMKQVSSAMASGANYLDNLGQGAVDYFSPRSRAELRAVAMGATPDIVGDATVFDALNRNKTVAGPTMAYEATKDQLGWAGGTMLAAYAGSKVGGGLLGKLTGLVGLEKLGDAVGGVAGGAIGAVTAATAYAAGGVVDKMGGADAITRVGLNAGDNLLGAVSPFLSRTNEAWTDESARAFRANTMTGTFSQGKVTLAAIKMMGTPTANLAMGSGELATDNETDTAIMNSGKIDSARASDVFNKISKLSTFDLFRESGGKSLANDPTASRLYKSRLEAMADMTGSTRAEVAAALKSGGFDSELADMKRGLVNGDTSSIMNKFDSEVLHGSLLAGVDTGKVNLGQTESAEVFRDFMQGIGKLKKDSTATDEEKSKAKDARRRAKNMFGAEAIGKMEENWDKTDWTTFDRMMDVTNARIGVGGDAKINEVFRNTLDVAESTLMSSRSKSDSVQGALKELRGGNARSIFDIINSKDEKYGDARRILGERSEVFNQAISLADMGESDFKGLTGDYSKFREKFNNVTEGTFEAAVANARDKDGKIDSSKLRNNLSFSLLQSAGMSKPPEEIAREKEGAILERVAGILDALAVKLKIPT